MIINQIINYMGIIFGRRNDEDERQGRNDVYNQQQANRLVEQSAFRKWQNSAKSVEDFITYLESIQSIAQKHEKAKLFICSITQREKLITYLLALQNFLMGANKPCILDTQSKSSLINFIHPKLANLWFIWNQISSPSITPLQLHDRLLPELQYNYSYPYKLQILFDSGQTTEALGIQLAAHHWEWDRLLKEAIRTNYPFLISKQTLEELFRHIIEQHVFLNDTLYFVNFIKNLYEQVGSKRGIHQCRNYIQRLLALKGQSEQNSQLLNHLKSHQQSKQNQYFIKQLLEAGRLFLGNGYPHAMQLIFQAINYFPQTQLQPNQIMLYTYTKIYSLFVYCFEEINLQYQHLQKMPISSIIHLMLRDNNFSVLSKLQQVLKSAQQLQIKKKNPQNAISLFDFQHQISQYIFSNYCNLQMCLQVLDGENNYVEIGPSFPERQQKLVLKLNQYKFQVIILNQTLIQNLYQSLLIGNDIFKQISGKIQQILQIVRLLYMFGVNQKFSFVTVFYCPEAEILFDEIKKEQIQIIEQEKALHLFKIFVSKFYISGERSKKILLNSSRVGSQTAVDLSKPEAIFQISQYLFDKILKKGLHSMKQIHQIIFQHMIYFYKYEEAKAALTNQSMISKFNINVEMLQIIVIDNIVKTIKQSLDIKKDINDINFQLKLIKNNKSVESQSAKAMVKLVSYLNQNGVQLTIQQKDKMDMSLLLRILNKYADRIEVLNFDTIYEYIKTINSNQIIENQQKLLMTNQLLKFKSKLAAKAFELGKRKLGNQIVDEISRFDPPWLTTELIEIFKFSNSKIDRRVFGIALKSCSKGTDLKYLMSLWKQQQGKQRRKQKGFSDLTEYFQTGRQYLVIDDQLIKNEQSYRNYVAQSQFSDQILHIKKYQLFFVLLGSQPERAFHYALTAELDPFKIDTFLKQAMKTSVINPISCIPFLHKYQYFVNEIQSKRLSPANLPSFAAYSKTAFQTEEVIKTMKQMSKIKQKQLSTELYFKILSAYCCLSFIDQRFISTYFANLAEKSSNTAYQLLLNQKSRKNLLISLRQQPMGRSDILTLNKLCSNILDLNFIDLCIFSLANIANTSEQMDQKCENILHKIITLTIDKQPQCKQIVMKLIQKIFSTAKLFEILHYIRERENPLYRQIIKQKNLKILQLLGTIETGQQLFGLVPQNYFQQDIRYNPHWPLSTHHNKILRSCWKKTNILILSKFMYFVYGMNSEIQKKILTNYLSQHPDEELQQITEKLEN